MKAILNLPVIKSAQKFIIAFVKKKKMVTMMVTRVVAMEHFC